MTRAFGQRVHCPNCKTWITAETDFGRWVRSHPSLESKLGWSVSDIDISHESYVIHRYKTGGSRMVQFMMDVEVGICGKEFTEAQRDTLYIRNQIIRNRRSTPTKARKHEAGGYAPQTVYSPLSQKYITLRHLGVHALIFSGLGPSDSELITWDKKPITLEQLVQLLSFEIDPDTFQPLEVRPHHSDPSATQERLAFHADAGGE